MNGCTAAVACHEARAGDFLLGFAGNQYFEQLGWLFLVLRQSGIDKLDIVGQGFSGAEYLPCLDHGDPLGCQCEAQGGPAHEVFKAVVELKMSALDSILLCAQDYVIQSKCNIDARMERLITPVTFSPLGAARFAQAQP